MRGTSKSNSATETRRARRKEGEGTKGKHDVSIVASLFGGGSDARRPRRLPTRHGGTNPSISSPSFLRALRALRVSVAEFRPSTAASAPGVHATAIEHKDLAEGEVLTRTLRFDRLAPRVDSGGIEIEFSHGDTEGTEERRRRQEGETWCVDRRQPVRRVSDARRPRRLPTRHGGTNPSISSPSFLRALRVSVAEFLPSTAASAPGSSRDSHRTHREHRRIRHAGYACQHRPWVCRIRLVIRCRAGRSGRGCGIMTAPVMHTGTVTE